MSHESMPPFEVEIQRSTWFAERAKPSMAMDEIWRLNEEALRLYPVTTEERQRKFEDLRDVPEFVL